MRPLIVILIKPDLGGIETYFAKISTALASHRSVIVTYLLGSPHPGLLGLFDARTVFVSPRKLFSLRRLCPAGADILATGRNALLFGMLLKVLLRSPVNMRMGVYSQYEMVERARGLLWPLYRISFNHLGAEQTFFCTTGLKNIQTRHDVRYRASPIVPLAVSVPSRCAQAHVATGRFKITTIGRFVEFKKYLFLLPEIAAELAGNGVFVEIDIHGYGPEEGRLRTLIEHHEVADRVRILGKLDPRLIDQTLDLTDIFIGSGSVLLEAASRGVPSLVCIDSNGEATSPGFIHDLPLFYTSEEREGARMHSITQLIVEFARLSQSQQNTIRRQSFEYCLPYYPDNVANQILALYPR